MLVIAFVLLIASAVVLAVRDRAYGWALAVAAGACIVAVQALPALAALVAATT